MMFKNSIIIAFRNIRKYKAFSVINLLGLSTSLAIVIIIASYAEMELSTNKFNKNYDRIYKVGKFRVPAPIADIIKLNLPEIKTITRMDNFSTSGSVLKYGNNNLLVKNIIYSEPEFFDIFSFPVIEGNIKNALTEPWSIVLTESQVKRIFGQEHPIDKVIKIDNKFNLTVKAVIKDIPQNSSMQFDGMISFITLKSKAGNRYDPYSWVRSNYETYVLAPDYLTRANIENKIKHVLRKNIPNNHSDINLDLFSLKEVYYTSESSEFNNHGSIEKNQILVIIAALILIIAIINYINLSTARVSTRIKEIGVRKTIGASKFTIIRQFLGESILISIISMILAIVFALELIRIFNQIMDLNLSVFPNEILVRCAIFLFISVIIGILSGTYPSFYLAAFTPGLIIKGIIQRGRGKFLIRKTLIIFQFLIANVLIISTVVIYQQTEYMRNKPMGFQKKNILYFYTNRDIQNKEDVFYSKILQYSGIEDFAFSFAVPGEMEMSWGMLLNYQGDEFEVNFNAVTVSDDFIRVMNIELIEGRNFIDKDSTDEFNVIINEAFARTYGLKEPLNARLKAFGDRRGNIIGVAKDFNFQSLHSEIKPLAFINNPYAYGCGMIKMKSTKYQDIKGVINHLKSVWKKISPDFLLEYNFLDEKLSLQYKAEERFEKAFFSFSLFAIFISCLGLFGLTLFSTEQRIKEIGIRKVLGASIPDITIMLSKQFIVLVMLSIIIACPFAHYFMNKWLQDFAYRIVISWWTFALSGGIALVIALATVSIQAVKAATKNPVESLKYE